jgi:hypothetical protein
LTNQIYEVNLDQSPAMTLRYYIYEHLTGTSSVYAVETAKDSEPTGRLQRRVCQIHRGRTNLNWWEVSESAFRAWEVAWKQGTRISARPLLAGGSSPTVTAIVTYRPTISLKVVDARVCVVIRSYTAPAAENCDGAALNTSPISADDDLM